jgi:hypothetical protein
LLCKYGGVGPKTPKEFLNGIDINSVWFNFKCEGQYLKQYVHQGTYLLILSILISIAIILYFFRGNLNFYKQNKFLKYLSFIWLAQNGILAISVGIRNFRYIEHYNLAYKRIGVAIFLLLTLYGLYTVLLKVKKKKSTFYLFKTNALAFYIILVISSLVNWDKCIATYNFSHSDTAFLDLDYLSSFSDKTLPYLNKTKLELDDITIKQKENFNFKDYFLTSESYYNIIQNRKKQFKKEWESKSFLSWNLAEYLAYKKLFTNK